MKVLIWGTGEIALRYIDKGLFDEDIILAFVDNNTLMWGKELLGKKIICPKDIKRMKYDLIVLCLSQFMEVWEQCIGQELQIPSENLMSYLRYEEIVLGRKMIEKYEDSKNAEIREIIQYYKEKGFNIYGRYNFSGIDGYPVLWNQDKRPYILFENKKMYFPSGFFSNPKEESQIQYYNVLFEQGANSPHLYIRNEDEDIKENAVIVDAGVCEGNFALRYVDKAKRIYLIESDPEWVEALKLTFADYQDKVIICDKFLGRYDTKNTITLDTLVKEEVDFIKMDIEGAEVDALLGAKSIFDRSNKIQCAICSYHNEYDEKYIKFLLEEYGMQTDTSSGYMCFQHDSNIFRSLDFRKGIVYGRK